MELTKWWSELAMRCIDPTHEVAISALEEADRNLEELSAAVYRFVLQDEQCLNLYKKYQRSVCNTLLSEGDKQERLFLETLSGQNWSRFVTQAEECCSGYLWLEKTCSIVNRLLEARHNQVRSFEDEGALIKAFLVEFDRLLL